MIQVNKIILWRTPQERDFDIIVKEINSILTCLQKYPYEYRANFTTAYSKADIKEFECSIDKIRLLLMKKKHNLSNGQTYALSFFSSKESAMCSGISMLILNGMHMKNMETILISLPYGIDYTDESNSDIAESIFKDLVTIFAPFWGGIINSAVMQNNSRGYMKNDLPAVLHWINYWSDDIVKKVGIDKIEQVCKNYKTVSFSNNILKLKGTALDAEKMEDMDFRLGIEQFLLG